MMRHHMAGKWGGAAWRMAALLPLMLLGSCILTPGKFVSTLDIRADRSFTFTYVGQVVATDMGDGMKSLDSGDEETDAQGDAALIETTLDGKQPRMRRIAEAAQDDEARMQAIAESLAKEDGFRSVKYVGNRMFEVDYAITSRLTHGFVFPFNPDAQAAIPFLAIELRKDNRVRVQAPGFADSSDKMGGGMGGGAMPGASQLDGSFTLTTDARIVSQNQEDGATDGPRGASITWKVGPLTRVAPMAILEFR